MLNYQAFMEYNAVVNVLDSQGLDAHDEEIIKAYKNRNSFGLGRTKKIYRIFQEAYLESDINNGVLTLPNVSATVWNDRLENPLSEIYDTDPVSGGNIDYGSQLRNYFALCWTERSVATEKDWEDFSHQNKAVRITTTVGKLLDRIMLPSDDSYMHRSWLVPVEYLSESEIRSLQTSSELISRMESTGSKLAMSAAIVKREYSQEEEIRFLFDHGLIPKRDDVEEFTLNNTRLIHIPFAWEGFIDDSESR